MLSALSHLGDCCWKESLCEIEQCVSHLAAGHQYCCLDIYAAITHEGLNLTLSFGISVDFWVF